MGATSFDRPVPGVSVVRRMREGPLVETPPENGNAPEDAFSGSEAEEENPEKKNSAKMILCVS